MKEKIYVSGPMKGVDNFEKIFAEAVDFVKNHLSWYEVVNPCEIKPRPERQSYPPTYSDFMRGGYNSIARLFRYLYDERMGKIKWSNLRMDYRKNA